VTLDQTNNKKKKKRENAQRVEASTELLKRKKKENMTTTAVQGVKQQPTRQISSSRVSDLIIEIVEWCCSNLAESSRRK
jgi:hypothetical protein